MNDHFDLDDKILANGPSPGTIWLILSKMKNDGQFKRVIQEGLKALRIYPSDIFIRKLLAEAYLEDGQITLAENELGQVAEQIKDLVSVYKAQAQLYLRQKREAEAREALGLFSAHYPDDIEARELLSSMTATAGEVEPEAIARPLSSEEATEHEAHTLPDIATPTLAEIYFQQGQLREARDIYERIVRENPKDEKSLERLEQVKALLADSLIKEQAAPESLFNQVDQFTEEQAVDEPLAEMALPGPEELGEVSIFDDPVRRKKERMIFILGKWLGSIQERTSSPWPEKHDISSI